MAKKRRSIADVYVTVLPETSRVASGIAGSVRRALKEADPIVREAGERWGRHLEKELGDVKVGVDVDADTTRAKEKIEKLDGKAIHVNVDVDKRGIGDTLPDGRKAGSKFGDEAGKAASDAFGNATKAGGGGGFMSMLTGGPGMAAGIVGLAGAASSLSGVLGMLPAATIGAGAAIGTLALAFDGFGDAMKNVKDPAKFAESLSQLAPAAQSVAKEIQGLMPAFDTLKFTVSDALFTPLKGQLSGFMQTIGPMAQNGLGQMGSIIGNTVAGAMQQLQGGEMMGRLQGMTDNLVSAFERFMPVLNPIIDAFSRIGQTGSAFLPQIADAAAKAAQNFADMIATMQGSGKLDQWIGTGVTAFGQLFEIMKNLMPIFGSLSPIGQVVLPLLNQLLVTLQPAFAGLSTIFANIVTVATPIINVLGQVLSQVITALAPAFTQLAQTLTPVITMLAQQLQPIIAKVGPIIGQMAGVIADALCTALQQVAPYIPQLVQAFAKWMDAMTPILPALMDLAMSVVPPLTGVIITLIQALTPLLEKMADLAKEYAPKFIRAIKDVADMVKESWPTIAKTIENTYKAIAPWIQKTFDLFNLFADGVNTLLDNAAKIPGLGNLVPDFRLGRIDIQLPDTIKIPTEFAPPMAPGGTVPGSPGLAAAPWIAPPAVATPGSGPITAAPPTSSYVAPSLAKPAVDWSKVPYTGAAAIGDAAAAATAAASTAGDAATSATSSAASSAASATSAADTAKDAATASASTSKAAADAAKAAAAAATTAASSSGYGAAGNRNFASSSQLDAWLLSQVPKGGRYDASGELAQGLADCSSGIEDLINILDGRSTSGRSMATGNAAEWLTSRGFLPTSTPVPGAFNVGFNSHHMEGTLPGGTKVNFGSDAAVASGGTLGAAGAWDPSFTQHYYRPATTGAPAGAPAQQSLNETLQAIAPVWNNTAPATTATAPTATQTAANTSPISTAYPPAAYTAADPNNPPSAFDVAQWAGPGNTSPEDLQRVTDAQQKIADTQFAMDQAGQKITEAKVAGEWDAMKPSEKAAMENALAKATREHADAVNGLTNAQRKYNEEAAKSPKSKDSGASAGKDFGSGFLGGIAESLGLDGTLFKNPMDFGLFKLFKGVMGLKPGDNAGGGSGGGSGGAGGAGGGGGGLFDSLISMIPKPADAAKIGSPADAGAPMIPTPASAGGAGAAAIPGSQFQHGQGSNPGPGNTTHVTYDNSMNLQGAQFGSSNLSSSVAEQQAAQGRTRVALRSTP